MRRGNRKGKGKGMLITKEFFGEPWTIFGIIVSVAFLTGLAVIYWWIRDEEKYQKEFRNYGE